MNPATTAVIVCAGPSFNAADLPRLAKLGDLLAINYVHIPWREHHPDLLPAFAFCADAPRKVFPTEWLEHPGILKVLQGGHGETARKRGWPNYEVWNLQRNEDWKAFPKAPTPYLRKPCKSVLLALQWLYHQGYETVLFYGVELTDASSYAGTSFKAEGASLKGKESSHDDIRTCLRWWGPKSGMRLINLSPKSYLAHDCPFCSSGFETLTIEELEAETDGPRPEAVAMDYEEVYEDLYQRGYHNEYDNCRGKRLARTCRKLFDFDSVLDIGCSNGWTVGYFDKEGKRAKGLEASLSAVQAARRLLLPVDPGSATELPYEAGAFDLVMSADTMEHLAPGDVPQAIAEQARVSKRYIACKVSPHEDTGHGRTLHGSPLHLTIQPVQRWIEQYLAACPEGSRVVWRERGAFVIEKGHA